MHIDMTRGSIMKSMLRFAVPMVLGNLVVGADRLDFCGYCRNRLLYHEAEKIIWPENLNLWVIMHILFNTSDFGITIL